MKARFALIALLAILVMALGSVRGADATGG